MKVLPVLVAATLVLVAGCAQQQPQQQPPPAAGGEPESSGNYYKDDGPPAVDEIDWRQVAEPVPTFGPLNPGRNRPYEVFGVRYVPFAEYTAYREQGMASWYGRRYH
ncbi:MAG: septal ring lytic transglycosylase RlpA family lipoprotein, partial [Betaproteobacteria bacterium]|nr:septal ring lytic transglycosylase RlpA family lipoprotein [Betaproteobacteria bacterium]